MIYRVLKLEDGEPAYQPIRPKDSYATDTQAKEAARVWVTSRSGRRAIVTADKHSYWSTVETFDIPGSM